MNIDERTRDLAHTIMALWGECVWQQLEPVDREGMLEPIKSALQAVRDEAIEEAAICAEFWEQGELKGHQASAEIRALKERNTND